MDLPNFNIPPSVSKATAVLVGLVLPSPLIIYSASCFLAQRTYLPARRGTGIYIDGEPALWLAGAYLSFALCFHFHFFWGSFGRLTQARLPLVFASILVFCVTLPTFIIKFLK